GREHAPQLAVSPGEGGGVVRDDGLLAVAGPDGELVVGDAALREDLADALLGALRLGEVVLEGCADELVAAPASNLAHLAVHVGDDPERGGGHERVDVRLDEPAGVALLLAQLLLDLLLLG